MCFIKISKYYNIIIFPIENMLEINKRYVATLFQITNILGETFICVLVYISKLTENILSFLLYYANFLPFNILHFLNYYIIVIF